MNTGRVKLRLKSTQEKPLSAWQLQDFINNINKGYTKIDLINEISYLLNKGIEPRNIVIINESYEIYNQYKYLRKSCEINLDNAELVEKLYNLGKPVSMFPNQQIIKINLIFTLYEKIYTLFNANEIPLFSKKNLKKYIILDFPVAMEELRQDCIRLININQINQNQSIYKKLEEYVQDILKKYDDFYCKIDDIEKFGILSSSKFSLVDYQNISFINEIETKYFKYFFKLLKSIERPIIFVFDSSENKMIVVKSEYMLNDTESDSFLDFKDYSHNSPFVITIIAGSVISVMLYVLCKGIKQKCLNIDGYKKSKFMKEGLNKDVEQFIKEVATSPEYNNLENVENYYIKNELENIQNSMKDNTVSMLKQKGVVNDQMQVEYEK